MKNFMNKKILLSLLLLFQFCLAGSLWAASLPYIDKSKIRLSLQPGKQSFGEITIENPTADARTMEVYMEDWYYLPACDGSKEFVPPGTGDRSSSTWVSFSPAKFTISPFGKQRVSYSVKVPAGTQSGGYYSAMFFETTVGALEAQPGKVTEAGIDLKVRIATLFYVEAGPDIVRMGQADNLVVKKSGSGLDIEMDFSNNGNVDITAGGSFYLMDDRGMVLARGEFNDLYTFPNDRGKFKASWAKKVPAGEYDLVVTLDLGKSLRETEGARVPLVTKEARVEIDNRGDVIKIGAFR